MLALEYDTKRIADELKKLNEMLEKLLDYLKEYI